MVPAAGHRVGWFNLALGLALLSIALGLGRSFGHHIPALEAWIANQGAWGYLAFLACVVVGTSIFVPDTAFAVMAGALFGVPLGTAIMVVACFLTAAVNYLLARLLLQNAVHGWLAHSPRLASIAEAVNREGLRFQILLRLTPINPVTISYVLGATGARFVPFLIACLGLLPALFVEVYFGYVAKHVAKVSGATGEHSRTETAVTVAGLVICLAVMVYIVRVARQALARIDVSGAAKP